ncbi:SpoIIAA family protein [Rubinisphaera italica]|uniref:SpoIIAA-like protein n=1 Tax=Rubinisphaera italica TaxID=2527969 RepID=A0A5C5XL77_9PLAN|nr:STAS/SEC14 domain-containing protein [Rubinisphaera italica]TWT63299.1 hypothetical protein Pan54_40520 [Rubinisphaera italica]
MLHAELLETVGILIIKPEAPLSEDDFKSVATIVDPYIEAHGQLQGILIQAEKFPGWKNFSSFLSHFRFVRDHHEHVGKVAAVSDSGFLEIAPLIARHFVKADVRHFPADEFPQAMTWLQSKS